MWQIISLILAAAVIFLAVYIYRVKKQLKNIAHELDRTAEKDYNRLVTVSLFDKDVNELASAVNREIDHRKQMKMNMQRTEEGLRRSVSDIAHDLRTPLSVIKGDLQLISKSEELGSEFRQYVDICIAKADEMKAMSDSFFELALLESDTSETELEKINMTNTIMKFIAENEGLIRVSELEPEIILPPKTVFVMANEKFIIRILGNLLSNVIKYSCGSFRLELCGDGRVIMSDPLPDGEMPETDKLFDRAYRGSRSRQGSGAGLGLHIVKLLMEKMSSEVNAEIKDGILSITLNLLLCK